MRNIWPRTRAGYERNDNDHEDMASQREMGDQCTRAKDFLSITLQVFYSQGNTQDSS